MTTSIADMSSISDTYWSGVIEEEEASLLDDEDGLFEHQHHLFGRTEEAALLLQTFQRVHRTQQSQTVVVHGISGVGKTSLIDTLRVPVLERMGCFCAGKFFQNSALHEPYSAVMAAFSDICDIVSQSDDFTELKRSEIREQLGSDGHLLTKAISSISTFLVDSTETADSASSTSETKSWDDEAAIDLVCDESSLSKFKIACKTFLQAMSSKDHPLVIFLDDIQWMDVGSRQLIDLFMNDKDLTNVLIILAYRDEEAENVASIFRTNEPDLVDIQLKSLDTDTIDEIVYAATGETSKRVKELSALVAKRSEGNPFHVQTFLEVIQSEQLMILDPGTGRWEFDVEEIRVSMMMQSDLAEILSRKIKVVNPRITETLKVASLMGYNFSKELLLKVVTSIINKETDRSRVSASLLETLAEAVKIGFIEEIKMGFQFTHDKIQTAFQELVCDQREVEQLHYIIGENVLSLAGGGGPSQDRKDYATMRHAAVHFNAARPSRVVSSDKERRRLVKVNLGAAKYCLSKSAYAAARDFLQMGLGWMSSTHRWPEIYYDLTFEMTELLAKAELVVGNFGGCKEATKEAIQHAKSTEMKINSLVLDVEVRMTNNEFAELIPCANLALRAVGVDMPTRVTRRHVALKFLAVKKKLRKKTDAQILALPTNNDRLVSTASKLLTTICAAALLRDETDLAAFAALQAMELTLKHGLSPSSSLSLVIYCVVETTVGNHGEAYRYTKLALRLLERAGKKSNTCLTVGYAAALSTWRKEPLGELHKKLCEIMKIGFEGGDIWGATICSTQAFTLEALLGKSLVAQTMSMRLCWDRIVGLGQDAMLLWLKPTMQYVLNLQRHFSDWSEVWTLTGDAMNEDEYIQDVTEARHSALVFLMLCTKSILASYFRGFKGAIEYGEQAASHGKSVQYTFGRVTYLYGLAFAHFELYRDCRKRKHLRKGRRYKRLLEKLVSDGCRDATPILAFVDAVEVSLKVLIDHYTVLDTFNDAIALNAAHGNHRLEGLLNELAGFDLVRRGHHVRARLYFDAALEIYKNKWCSEAKYQWLMEQSAQYSEEEWSPTMSQVGSVILCGNSSGQHPAPL